MSELENNVLLFTQFPLKSVGFFFSLFFSTLYFPVIVSKMFLILYVVLFELSIWSVKIVLLF